MDEINCIFCSTSNNPALIEENGYTGRKCPQCGLIYVSPRPSLDEILDIYGHDKAHITAESHIASAFSKRLNARDNLKIIRSVIHSGDLLEIGAGAGYFLDEARKIGFTPHGLEFNPVQVDFIRDKLNIPCEKSSLSTSIFGHKQFDIVYHCNVISHFFDPISEFSKIHEVLKEDGFVVFETGNISEMDTKYLKYIPRFQFPDHLFFFNSNNIVSLLEKTGFEVIKIHRYSILPQLLATKVLNQTASLIKSLINKSPVQKGHLSKEDNNIENTNLDLAQSKPTSPIKQTVGNLIEFFMYILRCKVGRIAPRRNHPNTIIVVAKKI